MQAIYEPRGAAREYAPLACNLYRGCTHGCLYCYAPACLRLTREQFHDESRPRPGVLEALERDARHLAGTSKHVLLCFTSDPYPRDLAAGGQAPLSQTTRQALQILARYDIPVEVLTKAGMRAVRDFDLLAGMRAAFGTTLLFTRDEDRQEWEPNAAPVEDRIAAIRQAKRRGIPTWVSIEPIIKPEQAVGLIERLSDIVDEWRIGKLNHHPLAKTIDWAHWARRLLEAAKASGRCYLIKEALAAYLAPEFRGQTRGGPGSSQGTAEAARRTVPQVDAAQGLGSTGVMVPVI